MSTPTEIKKVDFTEKQLEAYNEDIDLMCHLRTEFNAAREELDGMNRQQYYDSNRKKDLSYIPPKKNKQDMRVVTGTTREKDTTLLSTLLNLNAVPDFTAFDSDDLVVAELGDDMTDWHKKSREIEVWDKKRPIIYREMISQGDVFVEDTFVEEFRDMPIGEVEWDPLREGVTELSFKRRLQKIHAGCAARMIRGNMVFLGDMTIEYIEDQDIVAICTIIPRGIAKARYSQWERWQNVPYIVDNTDMIEYASGTYSSNNNRWAMFLTEAGFVSEVKLYRKSGNRFQIYLNGTPMLPHNFPLTAMYRSGELPFAQGKFEPISNFALSKSQPSKTKVDQEIIDEVTMLMVEGFRQKRKPPMGSKTDKVFSPGIFKAGTVTPEVDANTFHSILPDSALRFDASEFSFYKLIKENINEKTTNDVYSGQGQQVDTLGQAEIMKEQQMLKLGSSVDGMINLERRLAWLRIENLIVNGTLPVEQDIKFMEGISKQVNVYKNITTKTTAKDTGEEAIKIIKFTDEAFPTIDEQHDEEEKMSKEQGKPVRIVYMSPQMLRAMRFKWFIIINPTPKSNDKLSQLLFVQNVERAFNLFGPEALNLEYVKQRYAVLINEDFTKFFKQMDAMQMLQIQNQTGANMNLGDKTNLPERVTNTKPLTIAAK